MTRLWALYRGREQERRIRAEARDSASRAEARGIPSELAVDSLRQQLSQRFAARAHPVAPKSRLHVIYATPLAAWEKTNIPPALERFGMLTPFYLKEHGFDDRARNWIATRRRLDEALFEFIASIHRREPVDMVVCYLSGWHIAAETIERINRLGIVTCNFSLDDRLSFTGSIRGGRPTGVAQLARAFDLNLTNASDAIVKYLAEGGLAMFWPEGANPDHFRPLDLPFEFDVSFVGACYGRRVEYVDYLRDRGINVATFGPGWPAGSVSADEMVRIYSRTRINLGFSGIGYSMAEACLKGRDFEVPMSGGLYLTTAQNDLWRVFDVGREVLSYRGKHECLTRIRDLLEQPDVCVAIRQAALARSRTDHTWERRFSDLFQIVGLLTPQTEVVGEVAV